jgi:hypothetical protein
MIMPCTWKEGGLGEFAGRVLFRRGFGYPGRLDHTDRVWLTFAGVDGVAEVSLNDRFLGQRHASEGPFEFEITRLLKARNELRVTVESPTGNGGISGEVAMEIRCTAFLRRVRLWADWKGDGPALHVEGEVAGTSDRPLDLYVLLDGATVVYTTVEARPEGRPFHAVADGLEQAREVGRLHEVRVELVDAATVWYRIERPFAFSQEPRPA